MALHGGGRLELKKCTRGLFGIRLGRCPGIIPEKISFLQFYSRFNPNALSLGMAFNFLCYVSSLHIHILVNNFVSNRSNRHAFNNSYLPLLFNFRNKRAPVKLLKCTISGRVSSLHCVNKETRQTL